MRALSSSHRGARSRIQLRLMVPSSGAPSLRARRASRSPSGRPRREDALRRIRREEGEEPTAGSGPLRARCLASEAERREHFPVRALTLEGVDYLASPEAGEALAALAAGPAKSLDSLATLEALRRRHGPERAAWLLDQARLRRRAQGKFPPGPLLFEAEALEMASAREVAAWRARRLLPFGRVLDLGAGVGGDTLALAAAGLEVVAVERDPVRAALLAHNLRVAGCAARVEVCCADWTGGAFDGAARAAFVDPARRRGGRRTVRLADGTPPLSAVLALAEHLDTVLFKAAPGVDRGEVPAGAGLEFVSLRGELKEALLSFGAARPEGAGARAVVLPGGEVLAPSGPEPPARVASPGAWLYEPDPAVLRAGQVRALGARLDAWQLDPEVAYLTGDRAVETPFARRWRVLRAGRFGGRKELARWLRAEGAGPVTVRGRGVPVDFEGLARRLPRARGGPPRTVFLSRSPAGPLAILAAACSGAEEAE
ncbi:MAG: SAM-dependent methyltransferase [Planctomycetota bacterium]|nr:MAG: SAM-dependent methyltransferase [Planctomycetota bacterium]